MSDSPSVWYTGALYSASTIRVGPLWFRRGSIPDVIFTPRVSDRRMCTPSRMPLASSVRRTSSMISSCEGMTANASACADAFSRSRCSARRKMRPSYRRSPSHTRSPPCTALSNGLMPALSRGVSVPLMLTRIFRLRSSKVWSISGGDPVAVQFFVKGAAGLDQFV